MGTNSDRINDALDDALVPNTAEFRNIFTGNVRMQASSYSSGQSILEVIDDAAEAEFPGIANRFVSKTGVFTFHGRLARFSPGDYGLHGIHTWKLGDGAAIADDTSTVQIRGLGWNRPRKAIINSAICTPKGIKPSYRAAQIVQDAASIAAYGIHSWSAEDLYVLHGVLTGNNALDECLLFANYYIATRKEPLTQVNQITVRSLDPSDPRAAQVWNFLCNAEIGDVITLTTTNPGGGGFADDFFIEGLHYTVEPLQPGYQNVTLELNVSPRGWFDFAWT